MNFSQRKKEFQHHGLSLLDNMYRHFKLLPPIAYTSHIFLVRDNSVSLKRNSQCTSSSHIRNNSFSMFEAHEGILLKRHVRASAAYFRRLFLLPQTLVVREAHDCTWAARASIRTFSRDLSVCLLFNWHNYNKMRMQQSRFFVSPLIVGLIMSFCIAPTGNSYPVSCEGQEEVATLLRRCVPNDEVHRHCHWRKKTLIYRAEGKIQ